MLDCYRISTVRTGLRRSAGPFVLVEMRDEPARLKTVPCPVVPFVIFVRGVVLEALGH